MSVEIRDGRAGLIENIRDDVQEVMLRFFPDEESEDEE
jgi:hypothetical protein